MREANSELFINFWINVITFIIQLFNPINEEKIKQIEFDKTLLKITQGTIEERSNLLIDTYMEFVHEKLENVRCLINGKIDIKILKESLINGAIEVDIFNRVLWGEIEDLNF